jgi:hypothetical protein
MDEALTDKFKQHARPSEKYLACKSQQNTRARAYVYIYIYSNKGLEHIGDCVTKLKKKKKESI